MAITKDEWMYDKNLISERNKFVEQADKKHPWQAKMPYSFDQTGAPQAKEALMELSGEAEQWAGTKIAWS